MSSDSRCSATLASPAVSEPLQTAGDPLSRGDLFDAKVFREGRVAGTSKAALNGNP